MLTFLKIGLFSFGGGYAMIPLIQKEVEMNSWLSSEEFVDIIAIAEMTPGPIAVNSATFVGYKTAGFWGGLAATAGVAAPSLVIILIVSQYFFKFQSHPLKKNIFYGIRPAISGLILTAAIFVSQTSVFNSRLSPDILQDLLTSPAQIINFKSLVILTASLAALIKFKLHPILVIAASGVFGVIMFYFCP